MFRRKVEKVLLTSASGSGVNRVAAVPVCQSQRVLSQQKATNVEKENSSSEIQNSQEKFTQPSVTQRSRFLSQRQALATSTQRQRTQGKLLLEITLYNCQLEFSEFGCELLNENDDPISFTRRLRCLLKANVDFPKNANVYLSDFKKDFVLTDASKLDKCQKYMHGIFIKDGDQKYQTQTSLIMCFFAIDCFKDELAKIILEQLKEYIKEKKEDIEPQLIALILTQFKFSDQILHFKTYDYLFEQLIGILSETQSNDIREIIIEHFREFDISKQEEAGRRLCLINQDNPAGIIQNINIISDLAIDDETATQLSSTILHFISEETTSQLPAMIKYLQYYLQSPDDIVKLLRDSVKWESCGRSVIVEIFGLVDKSFKRANGQKVMEAWTNAISDVKNRDDLRLIDFPILLCIADTNTETQLRVVKKIVTDHISKGLFANSYLKKSFAQFPSIITENSQTLLEMLDALHKSRGNQQIYSFLASCYKLLFRYSNEVKPIIGSLVNFLCEKKAQSPFSSASEFKIMILNIFNDVKNDKVTSAASILLNYKILLRALDLWKIELTFNEHRLFMGFLCDLAFKVPYKNSFKECQLQYINESKESLRDHLNMLVIKHINNPEEKIRQLGIIGAVKIVSALVVDSMEGSQVSANAVCTLEKMPNGQTRDAAELVTLMLSAAEGNEEMITIVYDELSLEFSGKANSYMINEIFANWMGETTLSQLEKIAVKEIDTNAEALEVDGMKLLNLFENIDESLESNDCVIKFGTMVLKNNSKDTLKVAPLFKLCRLINTHRFGNCDFMAGLCVMPIELPEHFGTPEDTLNDENEIASRQLDLYFHVCNWLREVIGGFIQSSTDNTLMRSIRKRLKQLIQIEEQLDRLLVKAPKGYLPPCMDYSQKDEHQKSFESAMKQKEKKISAVQKPPKKKKKMGKKKGVEIPMESDEDEEPLNNISHTIKSNQFCRRMENDVSLFLKEKFSLNLTQSDDGNFTLKELMYLLNDVQQKTSALFKPRKVDQKAFNDELKIIDDFESHVIPHLVEIFHEVNVEIEKCGEMHNDDEKVVMMKKAFCIILEMFEMIFSSKILKSDENFELLKKLLKVLLKSDTANRPLDAMLSSVIEHYISFEKNAKDMNSAVSLINFLSITNSFGRNQKNSSKICEMSERFLKQKWTNSEQGASLHVNLDQLFKIYIKKASNLEQLENIFNEIISIDEEDNTKITLNEDFPSFTKGNVIIMLRTFIRRFSEIINTTRKNNINVEFLDKCTRIEMNIVDVVTWNKTYVAFLLFLKNFVVYLRKFNSDGMTMLTELAQNDTQKFVQKMKDIAKLRRSAHGAANELKHRKKQGVASILPIVRQQLETFFQNTSAIAKQNNILQEAIIFGQLRNFDIFGEDISSQNTTAARSTQRSSLASGSGTRMEEDEVMDVDDNFNMDTSSSEDDDVKSKPIQRRKSIRMRSTILPSQLSFK